METWLQKVFRVIFRAQIPENITDLNVRNDEHFLLSLSIEYPNLLNLAVC